MNDLPGRGDVNPYGIPVPNPHEQEGPDEEVCFSGDEVAALRRMVADWIADGFTVPPYPEGYDEALAKLGFGDG